MSHVSVTEEGCWEWTGYIAKNGYAIFRLPDKRTTAHRAAYELLVGPIPEGLTLDHLCYNRRCVNPAHLEPVTQRENTLRSPRTQATKNATKTHCKRGHPLEGENLALWGKGRHCRTCHREWHRARYRPTGNPMGRPRGSYTATHCPQGHAYDIENTRYEKTGGRKCRTCDRERHRKK